MHLIVYNIDRDADGKFWQEIICVFKKETNHFEMPEFEIKVNRNRIIPERQSSTKLTLVCFLFLEKLIKLF